MKIIRIKTCGDCPYCRSIGDDKFLCVESNVTFIVLEGLPYWCSLDNSDAPLKFQKKFSIGVDQRRYKMSIYNLLFGKFHHGIQGDIKKRSREAMEVIGG